MASKGSGTKAQLRRSSKKRSYYERQFAITEKNKARRAKTRARIAAKWHGKEPFNRYKTPQRIARRARKLHIKFSALTIAENIAVNHKQPTTHLEGLKTQVNARIVNLHSLMQPATT